MPFSNLFLYSIQQFFNLTPQPECRIEFISYFRIAGIRQVSYIFNFLIYKREKRRHI